VGVVDWDGAGPGSRLWDLAYAAAGFVFLPGGSDPAVEGPRLRALVDGYRLTSQQRRLLPALITAHTRGMVSHGLRGAVVIELLLEPAVRGRGYGRDLSVLLARALPLPDDQLLFGTIHTDNLPAYTAATRAGRLDVGGEILIPIPA